MQNFKIIFILFIVFFSCKKDSNLSPLSSCINIEDKTYIIEQPIKFNSCSENSNKHQWDFGDGNQSEIANPTHVYKLPGKYFVEHYVYNSENEISISSDSILINHLELEKVIIKPTNDTLHSFFYFGYINNSPSFSFEDFTMEKIQNKFFYTPMQRMFISNNYFRTWYYEFENEDCTGELLVDINWEDSKTPYQLIEYDNLSFTTTNDTLGFSIEYKFKIVK